jgi:hypothetical protein
MPAGWCGSEAAWNTGNSITLRMSRHSSGL